MTLDSEDQVKSLQESYYTFETPKNDPSSIFASTTTDGELRNVSVKTLIATKYLQLNEIVLESFGLTDPSKIQEIHQLVSGPFDHQEWIQKLENEIQVLENGKNDTDNEQDQKLASLNAKIEEALSKIPPGQKFNPPQKPQYTVRYGAFKSAKIEYQKAPPTPVVREVSQLESELAKESEDVEMQDILEAGLELGVEPTEVLNVEEQREDSAEGTAEELQIVDAIKESAAEETGDVAAATASIAETDVVSLDSSAIPN